MAGPKGPLLLATLVCIDVTEGPGPPTIDSLTGNVGFDPTDKAGLAKLGSLTFVMVVGCGEWTGSFSYKATYRSAAGRSRVLAQGDAELSPNGATTTIHGKFQPELVAGFHWIDVELNGTLRAQVPLRIDERPGTGNYRGGN
jgi:hypothetical protein